MAATQMHVFVCYATSEREILRDMWLEQGATVGAAIEASGIVAELAALQAVGALGALADPRDPGFGGAAGFDPALHQVGIFGKKKSLDTVLRDGDRVELYRPLLADPKESRRRRASGKSPQGAA